MDVSPAGLAPAPLRPAPAAEKPPAPVLLPWLRAQSINVTRHAAALRPFRREEFGNGAAAPSEGHIQAVNQLIGKLRQRLMRLTKSVTEASAASAREPTTGRLQAALEQKERAHRVVEAIERIWDFYFELFGQRQGQYADWLLSCDRIALDCYRVAYTGARARPSRSRRPALLLHAHRLCARDLSARHSAHAAGAQINPFPLIQLPYHRLVNPWTLGAVLHEVSHNLQSDLGLSQDIPRSVASRLLRAKCGRFVATVWARWNREMFADMCALLLGGPGIIGSMMDVVGRGPETVLTFNPEGVHPTPYFRTLINLELLRRMGFPELAEQYRRAWTRIYPNPMAVNMPRAMVNTFAEANALAVDAMCFRPYASLGGKSLAQMFPFRPKDQTMIEEASRRLAAGVDPGIVPERFLIGAARFALDQKLARPGVIAKNFYQELARR